MRKPVQLAFTVIYVAIIASNVCLMMVDGTANINPALFAYPASIANNDTIYIREAMQQEDKGEFLKAMVKEIEDHTAQGHWRVITRKEIKQRNYVHKPIITIWSFKQKRNPMGDIIKYKARLCCHGGQTIKGVHYDESYLPVVLWSTICLLLTMSIIHKGHARQMDFVLAFPQAKVQANIYMQVPEIFNVKKGRLVFDKKALHSSKQDAVVKLIQNVYGLVDSSYT